jgi:hypothetical protein
VDQNVARHFIDCDYLFLAADRVQARLLFNAIVHQYLIPGTQLGSKVTANDKPGELDQVFSVVRPIRPGAGCLWCSWLISPSRLQAEAETEEEKRVQRYVNDATIVAPSVITLNAVAAAHATNDFLFSITGLTRPDAESAYARFSAFHRRLWWDQPMSDAECMECGLTPESRLARGDRWDLPTRLAKPKLLPRTAPHHGA